MKKIKIIRSRPLKEEEEVIDQQPQDVAPEAFTITFESNPLEFILQKYPTLTKTLVDLLTEDFRDYITGVYIMAPKPTTFKIVLHNNRYFHLMFMGEDKYEAKVSGKKYWLAKLGELQLATLSIADLLMLGTPPSTEGPTEELPAASSEETPTETPEETPTEEEGGVPELKESVKRFKIVESLLSEMPKNDYSILTPDAQKVAQILIKKLGIKQDQIKPKSSNGIVIYDDNRKNLISTLEKLGIYGKPKDENSGDFKVDNKISINFKPLKTSGEYYELKPQSLGITTDQFIPINQAKKELINGLKNHKVLSDEQKEFAIGLVNGRNTLSPEETKDILDDNGFINEVLKNLGEIVGAIEYAKKVNGNALYFFSKPNEPLVDYKVKTNDRIIDVSAKTSKGKGNLIKLGDVYEKIKNAKLKLDPKYKEFFETTTTKNPRISIGVMNLINKYGSPNVKELYKKFLKSNPGYLDKSRADGSKYGYDSQTRTFIERQFIKDLNKEFDFNKLFQKAIDIPYVKYDFDRNTLKPTVKVIQGEDFNVYLGTKNSKGHDGEGIGFQLA